MIEDDLQTIYNKVFQEAIALSIQYNPQKIAATYMAIAIRMYKTVLAPEEFKLMMETVGEQDVEPYKGPSLH